EQAVVQHAVPFPVEVRLAEDRLPGEAHHVVARRVGAASEQGQHLEVALPLIKRKDERLHDAQRAGGIARVSPRLEEMRAGDRARSACGVRTRIVPSSATQCSEAGGWKAGRPTRARSVATGPWRVRTWTAARDCREGGAASNGSRSPPGAPSPTPPL